MEESRAWRVVKQITGSEKVRKQDLKTVRNKNKGKKRGTMKHKEALTRSGELGEESGCLGILPGGESIPEMQYIEMKSDDELKWIKRIQDELRDER